MKKLDFTGKAVIVTGGTKGVGRGIAQAFLEAGADVVVCSRSEVPELPSANGKTAVFVQADVREVEQIDRVVTETVKRFGKLDVLVNNAGGAPFALAAKASPRFHEKILTLNLVAPLHFMQRANAQMQTQPEGGAIVNIASISGARPSPGTAAYGAAKAGLLSLTQSLGIEWAPKVRVNAITAGMIRTEQAHLHYGDEAGIARVSATVPMGRLALPDDVAGATLFLASDVASYITGASILLHGGGEKPAFLDAAQTNNG
jgi:NAD(P)-dependent dehydrogenase (short-subunit alcohol dehydrogenase family)